MGLVYPSYMAQLLALLLNYKLGLRKAKISPSFWRPKKIENFSGSDFSRKDSWNVSKRLHASRVLTKKPSRSKITTIGLVISGCQFQSHASSSWGNLLEVWGAWRGQAAWRPAVNNGNWMTSRNSYLPKKFLEKKHLIQKKLIFHRFERFERKYDKIKKMLWDPCQEF